MGDSPGRLWWMGVALVLQVGTGRIRLQTSCGPHWIKVCGRVEHGVKAGQYVRLTGRVYWLPSGDMGIACEGLEIIGVPCENSDQPMPTAS